MELVKLGHEKLAIQEISLTKRLFHYDIHYMLLFTMGGICSDLQHLIRDEILCKVLNI